MVKVFKPGLISIFILARSGVLLSVTPFFGAEEEESKTESVKIKGRETPVKPRFEIKEKDWPAVYGEASVCLWKDDALAAFSATIDDNCFGDTPWWLAMGEKYGLRFTWFVITRRIAKGENPSFNGTWEGWRKIYAAGHDVQSHTALHGHIEDPEWKGIEPEYAGSKKDIEENMPGNKCLVLGYYGGKNSNLNDPVIAAKYYIGARGSGPINKVNQIDYMQIHSTGGVNNFPISGRLAGEEGKTAGADIRASGDMRSLFEKSKASADFYRGWLSVNSHFVCASYNSIPDEKKREAFKKTFTETSGAIEKRFAVVRDLVQEGKLWAGLVREICLYARERDTAGLKVLEKTPAKIVFKLTDRMEDALFDFPLTVKVRLNASWKTAKAAQDAKAIPVKLVEHEGSVYALVQAVPDRGEAVLEK